MTTFLTLGGRVQCTQCKAMSKRTRLRCRAPAIKGKAVCRFHGGKSTGPKTKAGRARIAAAHTVHGRETRQKRADTSAALALVLGPVDLPPWNRHLVLPLIAGA